MGAKARRGTLAQPRGDADCRRGARLTELPPRAARTRTRNAHIQYLLTVHTRGVGARVVSRAMVAVLLVLLGICCIFQMSHSQTTSLPHGEVRRYASVPKARHVLVCDIVWRYAGAKLTAEVATEKFARKPQRFRDNGELRFSMRSLAAVQGVRLFHIISRGDPPNWLNTAHQRVRWWHETQLVHQACAWRNISCSKYTFSSEPSKLAVAVLPQLAERFVLMDDDYFVIPPLVEPHLLSTNIFFGESGLPLHPAKVRHSHLPIPMLKAAFVAEVSALDEKLFKEVLFSKSRFDPLPMWCEQMWNKSVAIPVRFDNCNGSAVGTSCDAVWLHQWDTTVPRVRLGPAFASLTAFRPLFLCVNDDWPVSAALYARSIQIFWSWLNSTFPEQASHEIEAQALTLPKKMASAHDREAVPVTCASGEVLSLPSQAFELPQELQPLLSQLTVDRRRELAQNPRNLSASELTASIQHLDIVDMDNSISVTEPPRNNTRIRVAELNAERGRFWCEFAHQIQHTPTLKSVDIWLLNEFDLGMARSEQQHTARLLAYALGFNYAWATEFVELTNGNQREQLRTAGRENTYGLHGNAILSRWPLRSPAVVRMPGMDRLYTSQGFETARGYEKRLGGRMTLFAETLSTAGASVGDGVFLLGATHAQTSWAKEPAHTTSSIELIRSHIDVARRPLVLLGGDTWNHTCKWLGLAELTPTPSPTNKVLHGKVHLTAKGGMDDYICARGMKRIGHVERFPTVGRPVDRRKSEFRLSDHVFVTVTVAAQMV